MGLEPMTLRLKVWCSTDWANRAHIEFALNTYKANVNILDYPISYRQLGAKTTKAHQWVSEWVSVLFSWHEGKYHA